MIQIQTKSTEPLLMRRKSGPTAVTHESFGLFFVIRWSNDTSDHKINLCDDQNG